MHVATRFAVLQAARHAAHQLGDYWVQTDRQASTKGASGRVGRKACLTHVAGYTAANVAAVVVADRVFNLGVSWRGVVAGELVSAVTHYVADRRDHGPLLWLADKTGSGRFARDRDGLPLLDQAWHHVFNTVAAAVTAAVSSRARGELGGSW